jgi:hypothetical protein
MNPLKKPINMNYSFKYVSILLLQLVLVLVSCKSKESNQNSIVEGGKLVPKFQELSPVETGLSFSNDLDIEKLKSVFEYVNAYNGGGVAVGDFNNDNLQDIFFTGNLVDNKLYFNKGNLKFEDVSDKAGIKLSGTWCSGVATADVNNDGFLDIYVCRNYYDDPAKRENVLFINKGDGTFTDQAKQFGVNDASYTITATFLDYNHDGLVDLLTGNHHPDRTRKFIDNYKDYLNPPNEYSTHLYKNNGNGTFSDVTREANIQYFGWVLGLSACDYNNDGFTDVFIAVDHDEPDALFINDGNGKFTNQIYTGMYHISKSSMGVDFDDINHDGYQDLMVVEMAAMGNYNEKANMAGMNIERFWELTKAGYHYQYMRNMLHLNNGNNTFSEIGQMAGVDRSEWSWSPLFFDANNDGEQDLFISNGYYKNIHFKDTWKDFNDKMMHEPDVNKRVLMAREYCKARNQLKVENQFFLNNGDLTFKESSKESGIGNRKNLGNGAAYADFDNDGDLDMVVNNIDEPASFYKNLDQENGSDNHYLRVKFANSKKMHPFGAKVVAETDLNTQYREFNPVRGYQSAVEPIIHFGLGNNKSVKKLTVQWPDGKCQTLEGVKADQVITLNYDEAAPNVDCIKKTVQYNICSDYTKQSGINFKHTENNFDDYKVQVLLPHNMSQWGPHISKADINNDKIEDFFVGGAAGQEGAVYIQNSNMTFSRMPEPAFSSDKKFEDIGSAFFDADKDGDLDLYVVSGGYEFGPTGNMYQDRLYLNDGKGNFTKSISLPSISSSGSCIIPVDIDGDGDLDLFRGGRQVGSEYPKPAQSYFMRNDNGTFVDVSAEMLPNKGVLGMVTDAEAVDLNDDKRLDLLVTGEWMPLTFLINEGGKFIDRTKDMGFEGSTGWWFSIEKGDFNNDGKPDFVVGNLGTNYKYKASKEKPIDIYGNDFDDNGKFDIVLGYLLDGTDMVPIRGRQCSSEQIPSIKEKFKSYNDFAKANLVDVYGKENLDKSIHYRVTNFKSGILMNKGGGKFELQYFSNDEQIAPIMGVQVTDINGDNNQDIVIGGNLFVSEVETGRADAGKGRILIGDGKGNFKPLSVMQSGLYIPNDIRDIKLINTATLDVSLLLVANNNYILEVVKMNKKKIPAI